MRTQKSPVALCVQDLKSCIVRLERQTRLVTDEKARELDLLIDYIHDVYEQAVKMQASGKFRNPSQVK